MPLKRKRPPARSTYDQIVVKDEIIKGRNVRLVSVECPLNYPGLSPTERRMMYEGLGMVAEAFRLADARCREIHERRNA